MDKLLTRMQKRSMGMLGGDEVAQTPGSDGATRPERFSSYLARLSCGMAIFEKTMFAARDIPLMAPKTALPPTVAMSMPPRTRLV